MGICIDHSTNTMLANRTPAQNLRDYRHFENRGFINLFRPIPTFSIATPQLPVMLPSLVLQYSPHYPLSEHEPNRANPSHPLHVVSPTPGVTQTNEPCLSTALLLHSVSSIAPKDLISLRITCLIHPSAISSTAMTALIMRNSGKSRSRTSRNLK